jgi:hypothetical protein
MPGRFLGVEPFFINFLVELEAQYRKSGSSQLMRIAESPAEEIATYRRCASELRVDGLVLLDRRVNDPGASPGCTWTSVTTNGRGSTTLGNAPRPICLVCLVIQHGPGWRRTAAGAVKFGVGVDLEVRGDDLGPPLQWPRGPRQGGTDEGDKR